MTVPNPDTQLDAIRREIDSIDDQIAALLARRFAATDKVRLAKVQNGSLAASPFRPAREAVMIRRLIQGSGGGLPADVLVRLWRVILSASIQSQAPVTLHMHVSLGQDLGARLQVGQHFCGMAVALHDEPSEAITSLQYARGDLAVVARGSDWASGFPAGDTGGAQVIGTLPVLSSDPRPQLLIFGFSEPQPSGDDETLVVFASKVPNLPDAAWQARSGTATLAGFGGFLPDDHPSLTRLLAQYSPARVAGRYPRPIKVSP